MKITYWSDFNCIYSYIGLKRLNDAIDELKLNSQWEMKAFELKSPVKYDCEAEEIARESGLKVNLKNAKTVNTRPAHRLVKYAKNNHPEKVHDLIFKIYEYHFKENKDISKDEILIEISSSLGFDKEKINKMLSSESFEIEVIIDEEDAFFEGIFHTPFYMLETEIGVLRMPGAYEKIDFKIALEDLINGNI